MQLRRGISVELKYASSTRGMRVSIMDMSRPITRVRVGSAWGSDIQKSKSEGCLRYCVRRAGVRGIERGIFSNAFFPENRCTILFLEGTIYFSKGNYK